MQIYNTPIIKYNNFTELNNNCKSYINKFEVKNQVNFNGLNVLNSKQALRPTQNYFEYTFRVIGNFFVDLFQTKSSKELDKVIANIKPAQTELFLNQLYELGKLYGTQKLINVNIESGILKEIAQMDDSAIFIMNHSNQKEDPQMLANFITLLADAYLKAGKFDFPLPKIILNEDILKAMNPTKRKAFENLGAVGIDASVQNSNKDLNAKVFFPLIKDFIQNKCNIFIFPEGRLAVRKDLDFFDRFQKGISVLVNKILGFKKNVTVVPIGFAYGKDNNKNINAMNIGTPIVFKREGDITTVTSGDILKKQNSPLYNFFNKNSNKTDIPMTSEGEPIVPKELESYIQTLLCENLEINSEIASKIIKSTVTESEVILY